jgi:hypothetical protein
MKKSAKHTGLLLRTTTDIPTATRAEHIWMPPRLTDL